MNPPHHSLTHTHTVSWDSPFIITSAVSPIWAVLKNPSLCQLAYVIIHQQACLSPWEKVCVCVCVCVKERDQEDRLEEARYRWSAQRCCASAVYLINHNRIDFDLFIFGEHTLIFGVFQEQKTLSAAAPTLLLPKTSLKFAPVFSLFFRVWLCETPKTISSSQSLTWTLVGWLKGASNGWVK